MAVTKIWAIKDSLSRVVDYAANPEKTIYSDLQSVIHYAANGEKTVSGNEQACYVTGVNCNAETAFNEMYAVQERFNKISGNVAYHAYQSFKTGEVTPEQCHSIGVQLARDMWGTDYQVLVATHFNTGTYHNHFVINSVNMWTGKKFDCNKKAYYKFRDLSDKLCRDNELTVIENPSGKTPRSIHFAEKNNEPTKYNLMREAIDKAASMSLNGQQFNRALLKLGYIIENNPRRKYATIRSVNGSKPVRLHRLGEDYLPESIGRRMRMNPYTVQQDFRNFIHPQGMIYGTPIKKQYHITHYKLKGSYKSIKHKVTGIEALFIIFGYLIGIYPKNKPHPKPLSPEMRQACRQLDRYSEQIELTCREHFKTTDDVSTFINSANEEIKRLEKIRRPFYDMVSRAETEAEKNEIRKQYQPYTKQISRLRKDVKTAQRLLESKPQVEHCIHLEYKSRKLVNDIENNRLKRNKDRDRYER